MGDGNFDFEEVNCKNVASPVLSETGLELDGAVTLSWGDYNNVFIPCAQDKVGQKLFYEDKRIGPLDPPLACRRHLSPDGGSLALTAPPLITVINLKDGHLPVSPPIYLRDSALRVHWRWIRMDFADVHHG